MGNTEYVVVNLDDSTGRGTHWVACCNRTKDKEVYYYDSFGISCGDEITRYLKTSGKPIIYNSSEQQAQKSNRCGFYTVFVIKELAKGKEFYDVLYALDQSPSVKNERAVKSRT